MIFGFILKSFLANNKNIEFRNVPDDFFYRDLKEQKKNAGKRKSSTQFDWLWQSKQNFSHYAINDVNSLSSETKNKTKKNKCGNNYELKKILFLNKSLKSTF